MGDNRPKSGNGMEGGGLETMERRIRDLLERYDEGLLTKDDLVGQVGALAGTAPDAPPELPESTFRSLGLNHLALQVTDLSRSREFYIRHLGARLMGEGHDHSFLACGANHFIALLGSDRPGLHHFCLTVDGYEPGNAVETLRVAGFDSHREDDRVFFRDPDGLVVQISDAWGEYSAHMA